jgi:hypothetical protein
MAKQIIPKALETEMNEKRSLEHPIFFGWQCYDAARKRLKSSFMVAEKKKAATYLVKCFFILHL